MTKHTKNSLIICFIVLILPVVSYIIFFGHKYIHADEYKTKAETKKITFEEIVAADRSTPDTSDCTTKLQISTKHDQHRQELNRKYLGKHIEWTGKVTVVSESIWGDELIVKFQHNPNHIDDVTVYFSAKEKESLLQLNIGDMITYQGRIRMISNGGVFNIKVEKGKIIEKSFNGEK